MHTQLVDYRMEMKKRMQKQGAEDTALLNATNEKKHEGTRRKRISDNESTLSKENEEKDQYDEIMERWESKWDIVASRTGIDDPNVFFKRIHNRKSLEDQIGMLRRTAETRLEQLKKDAVQVETEMEEVRVEASLLGGHGGDVSDLRGSCRRRDRVRPDVRAPVVALARPVLLPEPTRCRTGTLSHDGRGGSVRTAPTCSRPMTYSVCLIPRDGNRTRSQIGQA